MDPQRLKNDIIPNDVFCKKREHFLQNIKAIKKNRNISVGPDTVFYFENHQTLWWQIQEMLRIERGGEEQLKDELVAYAPLLPRSFENGDKELVATLMIEIDDLERRFKSLRNLGGIEKQIFFMANDDMIQAIPEEDINRTNEDGKTSSVHFLRFRFNPDQVLRFSGNASISLSIKHPFYAHTTTLNEHQKKALSFDFL